MKLPIVQVDAFTNSLFGGNPAAIVPLSDWLPDETMQNIAMENQLSETAFFVPEADGYRLRWFTPLTEVDLCGHATLACAHVIFSENGYEGEDIYFYTRSGKLTVQRESNIYTMDFPKDRVQEDNSAAARISEALGVTVEEVYRGRDDYLAILESEQAVSELQPDFRKLSELDARGVLATARGEEYDFVSRCFFPKFGIDEDPATGSAHTTMAPYWAGKLGNSKLSAFQLSRRGAQIFCDVLEERVLVKGAAVTFLRGEISI